MSYILGKITWTDGVLTKLEMLPRGSYSRWSPIDKTYNAPTADAWQAPVIELTKAMIWRTRQAAHQFVKQGEMMVVAERWKGFKVLNLASLGYEPPASAEKLTKRKALPAAGSKKLTKRK